MSLFLEFVVQTWQVRNIQAATSITVKGPVNGHSWNGKKVSITRVAAYENGSCKQPFKVNGCSQALTQLTMNIRNAKNTMPYKGWYTRGSLLPQHAPATRSQSKALSSAPMISSKKICCATKLLLPSFAPSYQTGLI